jgi:hypothetical protein
MTDSTLQKLCSLILCAGLVHGCGDVTPAGTTGQGPAPVSGAPLPGAEEGAPMTMEYAVIGNPIVGQPIAVEITISTDIDDRSITLTYRPAEAGSLEFPESQPMSIEIVPVSGSAIRPQQVTAIPQRDGRVFLTVSASVETDKGAVTKSMSVPLEVRPAPLAGAADTEAAD